MLRRSRSSKVTEFGTNGKPICDFLLVINTNLASILHRFRDTAFDRSKIAVFGCSPDGGVPLAGTIGSGPLSQRSAIANVQGGLDWIQTIFFF